jgi:hypothetical protein
MLDQTTTNTYIVYGGYEHKKDNCLAVKTEHIQARLVVCVASD